MPLPGFDSDLCCIPLDERLRAQRKTATAPLSTHLVTRSFLAFLPFGANVRTSRGEATGAGFMGPALGLTKTRSINPLTNEVRLAGGSIERVYRWAKEKQNARVQIVHTATSISVNIFVNRKKFEMRRRMLEELQAPEIATA